MSQPQQVETSTGEVEGVSRLRDRIDRCDAVLLQTLAHRFELSGQVGLAKIMRGTPFRDEVREEAKLHALRARAREHDYSLPVGAIDGIFRAIMGHSLEAQRDMAEHIAAPLKVCSSCGVDLVADEKISTPSIQFDPRTHEVTYFGVGIKVRPAEGIVLGTLLKVAPSPATEVMLRERLGIETESNVLAVHLSRLRRRFGEVRPGHSPIRNIRGLGWCWEEEP